MALIICPECGKQISDKSPQCIHCGFPLPHLEDNNITKKMYSIVIWDLSISKDEYFTFFSHDLIDYGIERSESEKFYTEPYVNNKGKTYNRIKKTPFILFANLSESNANIIKGILDKYKTGSKIVETPIDYKDPEQCTVNINEKMDNAIAEAIAKKNAPLSCPRCGSTSVTTGQRGFSFITGFLGSNKTVNRCGKCGWTWDPKI